MIAVPERSPDGIDVSRATLSQTRHRRGTWGAADLRARLLGYRGAVIWLTGLSGAGKSTLANAVEQRLLLTGFLPAVLDGDVLRRGLCSDLGFTDEARRENIRRVTEAALLLAGNGAVVLAALISPFAADRQRTRERCAERGVPFAEVYVNAPLAECERRDPKQLYQRARSGEIANFTGISSPYEPPVAPTLEIRTDQETIEAAVGRISGLVLRMTAAGGSDE